MSDLPPFQSHSDTSFDAALGIRNGRATLRGQVLAWLRMNGPATDEQIQDHLDMNPSTERPRRVELVEAGLVADSGLRARTRSGRRAVVWAVVEPTGQLPLL